MIGQAIQSALAENDPLAGPSSYSLLCLPENRLSARQRRVRRRLAQTGRRRLQVPPGRRLVQEQSLAADFYNVLSGVLVATRHGAAGQDQVAGFYYPDDWILPQQPDADWHLSVNSLTQAVLEVYSLQDVRQACSEDPSLGFDLFQLSCSELSLRLINSERLRNLSVEERLAAFFVDGGRRLGRQAGGGILLELPMPRTMIAGYLGIRVETISRIIGRWKKSGLIELDGARKIIIPDFAGLKAIAEGRKAVEAF